MQAQAWRAATRTWGIPKLRLGPGMPRHARVAPGFIAARWPPEALRRQAQSIVAVVAKPVGFGDETGIRRQTTETAVTATFLGRRRGQRRLQSPNRDRPPVRLRVLPEQALFPRSPFPHVEDQQVSRLRTTEVHVLSRLLRSLADHTPQAGPFPQHLAFNNMLVCIGCKRLSGCRPFHKQVRPSAGDGILASDAPAAVDHAVQVGVQHKLRPRLPVSVALHPRSECSRK